jgi:hypothetical protein
MPPGPPDPAFLASVDRLTAARGAAAAVDARGGGAPAAARGHAAPAARHGASKVAAGKPPPLPRHRPPPAQSPQARSALRSVPGADGQSFGRGACAERE